MTAQQIIINKYGEPDKKYLETYCYDWQVKQDFPWFPSTEIFINKDFKIELATAFVNLEKANCHTEIKTYDGCFNKRNVRGSATSQSLHSWAMAIDLNAALNPMVIKPLAEITAADRLGKWSEQFIEIMKSVGITCGGYFIHRPDPMHFAMYDG